MSEIQNRRSQRFVDVASAGRLRESRTALIRARGMRLGFGELTGFLSWLFILARQKHSWSPVLIAGECWRLLSNFSAQIETLRLLRLRPYPEVVRYHPGFAFKHVVPDYLARSFTVNERASCFLHHYRRLHAVIPECALHQILHEDVTLHELTKDLNRYALTIGLSRTPFDKEGELSIKLKVNGNTVFILSFTIVPGWVVKSKNVQIRFC